jgi:hypothetical protein
VDLVVIELRALLASVSTAFAAGVAPALVLPDRIGPATDADPEDPWSGP